MNDEYEYVFVYKFEYHRNELHPLNHCYVTAYSQKHQELTFTGHVRLISKSTNVSRTLHLMIINPYDAKLILHTTTHWYKTITSVTFLS